MDVLEESNAWHLRALKAGEPSCKGYLLNRMISAQIEGQLRGLEKEQLAKAVIKGGEEAMDVCMPILEAEASTSTPISSAELEFEPGMDPQAISNMFTSWEWLTNDGLFDFELGANGWMNG
jgi:hypothetical protein